ncbi:MAG: ATP-dependent RNA helicase HrpA [Wenzhouxiangellaceae bacterium]
MSTLPELDPETLLAADCSRLLRERRRLAGLRPDDPRRGQRLERWQRAVARSQQAVAARRAARPAPDYDPALPITARRTQIIEAVREHPVVIVAGETGSGKSTQLPKMALEAGRGVRGLIGCTQPRRIAARSVARRVAEELGVALGAEVGFQVRFSDRSRDDTLIKFMTDGILLAEIHSDRALARYDTLIIDEAHERSLNIDFLLGYLKRLLARRRDLKVIITSATIDTARFAEHFGDAPVITVEGRNYPVDIEYQPPNEGEALEEQVRRAVARCTRIDASGDILVFLPGEREIFRTAKLLARSVDAKTEILPLYARLSAAVQDRVFAPHSGRRIVLATNVAETSLTVPGIRFVIDSGLARISRYATHSKVLRLPVEPVSQASCNQRAGRAGRVGPGTCIRLFDEADFLARPAFTEPEIQRSGLVGVVLEMLALGLGDPEDFPFLDPPPRKLINEAWNALTELQAVDDRRRLTAIGRTLASLPVDPRQGRMLLEAAQRGVLAEVIVLVAGLSLPDPRERPADQQQAADQAHAAFRVEGSDFLGLLALWDWWQAQRAEKSRSQADRTARAHFLNPLRLHEWGALVAQLKELARETGWQIGRRAPLDQARADAVHRSLLSGLLSQIGQHHADGEYIGARGHKFRIFPGSGLARARPGWLMAAELVETSRTWARQVAAIKPEWLESQARHLIRSQLFDPHWDRRSGRVMGYQRVTLFGLTLVEKRRVHYGPHDPETARRIFILHALVRGEIDHRAAFLKRNAELKRELAVYEQKRRTRDLLVDETRLVAFFAERLPAEIHTTRDFAAWYERLPPAERERLLYDRATLLRPDAELPGEAFPDWLEMGGQRLGLRYRFEPGSPDDGVTVRCPLHLLNRLDPARLEWLVPGLLEDKIRALIASLPKSKRRLFVPQAEYARAAREALRFGKGSLYRELAAELSRISGVELAETDFQSERLPPHLLFNVEVIGESGEVLATSRDLRALQATLGERARREFMDRQAGQWRRDGLKRLDDLVLPPEVRTRGGDPAWPALVDQGDCAGLRLFDARHEARHAHQLGVWRLMLLALDDKLRYLLRVHRLSTAAQIAWTRVGDVKSLIRMLVERVVFDALDDAWGVRDQAALDALERRLRPELVAQAASAIETLDSVICRWHEIRGRLAELGPAQPSAEADITAQLDDLIYDGFVADIEVRRLGDYLRYLEGIGLRLEALAQDPRRDVARQALVQPWWDRYQQWLADGKPYTEALDRFRWLIEEYRIQVFAQRLGTRARVSEQRLAEAWAAVEDANG